MVNRKRRDRWVLAGSVVTEAAVAMPAWPEEIPFGQSHKKAQIGLCFADWAEAEAVDVDAQ